MGYDLYVKRKIFVDRDKVDLDHYVEGKSKSLVISEILVDFSGWDIQPLVCNYLEMDNQEVDIEDILSLYISICESRKEEPIDSLVKILKKDLEKNDHFSHGGVFYELSQSY